MGFAKQLSNAFSDEQTGCHEKFQKKSRNSTKILNDGLLWLFYEITYSWYKNQVIWQIWQLFLISLSKKVNRVNITEFNTFIVEAKVDLDEMQIKLSKLRKIHFFRKLKRGQGTKLEVVNRDVDSPIFQKRRFHLKRKLRMKKKSSKENCTFASHSSHPKTDLILVLFSILSKI